MSELINNSQERVAALGKIIKELHAGADPATVKGKLAELVRATTSEEIVAMEQELMADGMAVEEIKRMCDLHSQVLRDLLDERLAIQVPAGHPLDTFRRENVAIADRTRRMRELIASLDAANLEATLARWRTLHEELMEVEKHYARKEQALFPLLERHGVTAPSQVMWGKDDDIRVLMKALREALTARDASLEEWHVVAREIANPMLDQIEEMIAKEERILFPMAHAKLRAEEWGEVHRGSAPFGACLVAPGAEYVPPPAVGGGAEPIDRRIPVGVGSVLPAELAALIRVMPVDLTFVDAADRVAFFSEGGDRIFARSPAIIGRKVQNCHPPHSVEVVDRILADFKAGRQNVAEFWITLAGRFVHIRYFAVRDEAGTYLGTLEVTQDLTRPRALTGERRLLAYEEAR
jgi:hypothetical protein